MARLETLKKKNRRRAISRPPYNQEAEHILRTAKLPLHVFFSPHPVLGILSVGLFMALALWSWWAQQPAISIFWLLSASFSFYALLMRGKVELNEKGVRVSTLFGSDFMAWDDIEAVHSDAWAVQLHLKSNNKLLAIPGFANWSRPRNQAAAHYFAAQLNHRNIVIEYNMPREEEETPLD